MKNVKRFLSLILVSVMVLAMSMPVFAAGEGKITITNDQNDGKGLKYEAYQVIAGDVVSENNKTTFSNVKWGSGVDETKILAAVNAVAGFENVKNAEDFVDVLSAQQNDSVTMQALSVAISKALGTKAGESSEAQSPYTISNLDKGYYFVQDVSGLATGEGWSSKYAMVVVKDDTATIKIKTDTPSQEKKVEENQGTNYTATQTERETWGEGFNDVADYNVGDTVPFQLYSKVPNFKGQKSYYFEFMDKMDASFTFNEDVVVYIDGQVYPAAKYTVKVPGNTSSDGTAATFSVVFDDLVSGTTAMSEGLIGKEIRITFSAVLNENAIIGRPGNYNGSKLRYGNKPGEQGVPEPLETPWDYTVVFTYKLDVNKVDGENPQQKLEDAKFVFYRKKGTAKEYVCELYSNGKVKAWKEIADAPAGTTDLTAYYEGQGAVVFNSTSGSFSIPGLDEGTYYLMETKAPEGYNLLKEPVEVVIAAVTGNGHNGADANKLVSLDITANGTTTAGDVSTGTVATNVENNQGVQLPETGGIGTTIFYIVGALMAIGAGVVLVTRRRMSK